MTICNIPGCPTTTTAHKPRCPLHTRAQRKATDDHRPNPRARGYDTQWETTRAAYLASHPTCQCDTCQVIPWQQRPPATDVHHLDGLGPHGPQGHDWSNLLALTHAHHAHITATTTHHHNKTPNA